MRTDDASRRSNRPWAIAGLGVVIVTTAAFAATYTPLFAARTIRLQGAGSLPRDDVLAVARLDEGSNVFHLDTGTAERDLEADPRIFDARVTTSLPDGILIRIVPRVPVAIVGVPGMLVGADGVVIGPAGPMANLPALRSEDGGGPAGRGLEVAAAVVGAMNTDLRRDVEAVVIRSDGDLEVKLVAGFSAYLGDRSELGAKAASLAALLDWAEEQDARVVSADLTVPGSPTAQLDRRSADVQE